MKYKDILQPVFCLQTLNVCENQQENLKDWRYHFQITSFQVVTFKIDKIHEKNSRISVSYSGKTSNTAYTAWLTYCLHIQHHSHALTKKNCCMLMCKTVTVNTLCTTLKMERVFSSQILVHIHQCTGIHIPQQNMHVHQSENLKTIKINSCQFNLLAHLCYAECHICISY